MTHPVYNRQQLEAMKRPQLWEICTQLGIHRFAKIEKLVEAILEKMPQPVEVVEEIQIEAKLDAVIINDGDAHQPWVAKVNGVEVDRDSIFLRFLNRLKKDYNVINEYEQCDFNSLVIWEESRQELDVQLYDVDDLDQHLEGLVFHSETSNTYEDINSPWVICEGRQYAVDGLIFREEKETFMQRCYEVFENGKFLTFVFAHTAKRGYLQWKYFGDNYADISSLLDAVCCERGTGRRDFTPTMSADNPLTVKSLSADRQHDRVDDTDNASPVTLEKVLLTTR